MFFEMIKIKDYKRMGLVHAMRSNGPLHQVWFLIEPYFIWCGVGECAGGVAVFGVNNVVDSFSKHG